MVQNFAYIFSRKNERTLILFVNYSQKVTLSGINTTFPQKIRFFCKPAVQVDENRPKAQFRHLAGNRHSLVQKIKYYQIFLHIIIEQGFGYQKKQKILYFRLVYSYFSSKIEAQVVAGQAVRKMMSLQCCLHYGMRGKSKHSIRASFETGVHPLFPL